MVDEGPDKVDERKEQAKWPILQDEVYQITQYMRNTASTATNSPRPSREPRKNTG
jgi:hypothetical protein